jgi:hypothetical protein
MTDQALSFVKVVIFTACSILVAGQAGASEFMWKNLLYKETSAAIAQLHGIARCNATSAVRISVPGDEDKLNGYPGSWTQPFRGGFLFPKAFISNKLSQTACDADNANIRMLSSDGLVFRVIVEYEVCQQNIDLCNGQESDFDKYLKQEMRGNLAIVPSVGGLRTTEVDFEKFDEFERKFTDKLVSLEINESMNCGAAFPRKGSWGCEIGISMDEHILRVAYFINVTRSIWFRSVSSTHASSLSIIHRRLGDLALADFKEELDEIAKHVRAANESQKERIRQRNDAIKSVR